MKPVFKFKLSLACTLTLALLASSVIPNIIADQPTYGLVEVPQTEATNSGSVEENTVANSTVVEKPVSVQESINSETFIPSDEWQEIKPGQAIPPGLHVSIDMQTGAKKAKLLDKLSGKPTLSEKRKAKVEAAVEALQDTAPSTIVANANATTSPPAGNRIHELVEEVRAKWERTPTPFQEEATRIGIRILKRISNVSMTKLLDTSETFVQDLVELDDVVHDRTVAIKLHEANLLSLLKDILVELTHSTRENLHPSRNVSTSIIFRILSQLCLVLGSSIQNNEPVARDLATQVLSSATASLLKQHDFVLQKRALFLLSSMVRSHTVLGQAWTSSSDGAVLQHLVDYFKSTLAADPLPKTQLRKTTTLLVDALYAGMHTSCPWLIKREDQQQTSEMLRLDMFKLQAMYSHQCAPEYHRLLTQTCSDMISAWHKTFHELAIQEALLELVTLVNCRWVPLESLNELSLRATHWSKLASPSHRNTQDQDDTGSNDDDDNPSVREALYGYIAGLSQFTLSQAIDSSTSE